MMFRPPPPSLLVHETLTTSQERIPYDPSFSLAESSATTQTPSYWRFRGDTTAHAHSEASRRRPVAAVNHPANVDQFMIEFYADIDKLLPYCYSGATKRGSLAVCFVDRLTRQDREHSCRPDCTFFPPFAAADEVFYFRLVPLSASPKTRAFAVEYYKTGDYAQPVGVFGVTDWIKFEALLRLFFHRGFRYLMKVFSAEHPALA